MSSPSATTVPMHLGYFPIRDEDSSPVLPEKEHAGIKIVSPEMQHNVVHSSFRPTALVEELQESSCPPRHEKRIPCVELVGKDPMAPNVLEPSFILPDANRNAGLKTSEVVEIVNRTLVPPRAAARSAFNISLEKLLKETFGQRALLRHHLLQTRPAEFITSVGDLPRSSEELKPVPRNVPSKEDGQKYLNDNPAWEKNLLVHSLELIQPDACGVAQNRTDCPQDEDFEMVSTNNIPPNRECGDLNAKLTSLLKESATRPNAEDFASAQTSSHLRDTAGEILARSKVTNKRDRVKIVTRDGTMEATKEYADPKEIIQEELVGEQPLDERETAVKTIKPKSCDRAALRDNLKQERNEDSTVLLGDIEIPKLTPSPLQPDMSASSVCAKDTFGIQEVIESVEKSTVPSNSRQVELKAGFQTLLRENSEILPHSQKTTESSNEMQIYKRSTENRGFISQQGAGCVQEVNETANKISAPSRFQQSEFNSSLQKLLKEADQAPPSQHSNLPQEETAVKSVATKCTNSCFIETD